MSKTKARLLPSAPSGGNGTDASAPASSFPVSLPPASPAAPPTVDTIVTGARVALGYQRIAGGFLLADEKGQTGDTLIVDVPLTPGIDLRGAYHQAVDTVMDGLEQMRGA